MSDIFSSFEPVEQQKPVSKDYTDIKPFYVSSHGNSRLFVAMYGGKKVVLKALKAENTNDTQCRENLKKEYEITSQLDNRFIRKAIGFESIEGLGDCIVFEFIEGKSLAEHVRVGTLNEKQIKNIILDLCDGLNYMHQHGIIHCDLKPENIIVTANDYRAKIIDIGLPETEYKTDRELLIKENEFIAPELIKGEDADQRSDVYSLGKIIEFVIERNMLRQYRSVATHCIQFSREQRFDSVSEVKSVITKGYSVAKILLLALALVAIGVAAYIYIPKIIEKSRADKEKRLAVEFGHEMEKLNAETNALCEKYKLTNIDDPIRLPVGWREDSIRFYQQMEPYFEVDSLKNETDKAYNLLKQAVLDSRQRDFDSLVVKEFKNATDENATQLRVGIEGLSESQVLDKALQWYQKTH